MKKSLTFKLLDQSIPEDYVGYSGNVALLLKQRGISVADAQNFLYPSYGDISNPFLMNEMLEAVLRITEALESGEKIAVYCDYDADGVPGGVVLFEFFKKIGVAQENLVVYIPHRHNEGYGLHNNALDALADSGVNLVITIDLGIRAVEQVAYANTLGIDVIITDHHEPGEKTPDCVAIVNPKIGESYPDRMLCGCAVAFQLVRALLFHLKKNEHEVAVEIPDGWEKWLMDMVGISTISDMVPLVNENRMLAIYGLKVLRMSRRPGLMALSRVTRTPFHNLKEEDIGFTISPRLNAASRMDHANKAFETLTATDAESAESAARYLEELNKKRKTTTATTVKAAYKKLEGRDLGDVIVVGDPQWNHGIVGIVASKIVEKYGKPAFVWSRNTQGVVKGSCRGDNICSVVDLMEKLPEGALVGFGGHAGAGGFSCDTASILKLEEKLSESYRKLYGDVEKVTENIDVHLRVDSSRLNNTLYNEISLLAPFGVGNPKPVVCIENAIVVSFGVFGKTKEHTKLVVKTARGTIDAIAFFKVPDGFEYPAKPGDSVCLIGNFEKSTFAGRTNLRIGLIEVLETTL